MKVEFIKDFAVYKKKDVAELESTLGARLIHRKIVKKFIEKKVSRKKK